MDLAAFTDPTNMVTAVAGALAFATIVTLALPMLKQDSLEVRLKSVANRREELRRSLTSQATGAAQVEEHRAAADEWLMIGPETRRNKPTELRQQLPLPPGPLQKRSN